MTRSTATAAAFALVGAWLAFACRAGPPDSVEGGTKNSSKPQASKAEPPAAPSASVVVGPAPPRAPREDREKAVLSVLRGETSLSGLPVVATDNGGPVDPSFRDLLSPRKQTIVVPSRPPHVERPGDPYDRL
jgi:hypothetical protein